MDRNKKREKKREVVGELIWSYERKAMALGRAVIAGVDEAGRGCLAGPVYAAAFVFVEMDRIPHGLDDSKKLSRKARATLFQKLTDGSMGRYGVGSASAGEIDRLNILRASHLAMNRAIESLESVEFALVDGLPVAGLMVEHEAIVGGDAISPSIAAASIIAKESRDIEMERMGLEYRGYGFGAHKGYGTREHLEALRRLGPCPIHRYSFEPVRQLELLLE